MRARVIIEEILDLALNRHIHKLSESGYLNARKYQKDFGVADGEIKPALRLKRALMDEICNRFEPAIADYLMYPRDQLWPVHDSAKVEAQLRENLPDGKLR